MSCYTLTILFLASKVLLNFTRAKLYSSLNISYLFIGDPSKYFISYGYDCIFLSKSYSMAD